MIPIEALLRGAGGSPPCDRRPWVTLSYASDGSLAAHRGSPFGLSGEEPLTLTHWLRAAHDAVLVGIGTVLSDNPRLTVRWRKAASRTRSWIATCAAPRGEPAERPRQPWIATLEDAPGTRKASLAAAAQVLHIPADDAGRVRIPALLECLAGSGSTA